MSTHILTKTVKNYSPGTRVKLLNFTKAHTAFVQVECLDNEVLEISQDDFTERRDRTRVVNTPNAREKRKAKKELTTTVKEDSPNDTGEQ